MRDTISKLMTGAMIASAALLVSACGKTEPAADNSVNVTELNAMDDTMMNGTTNDSMTSMDGTNAMDGNMAADVNAMDMNASNASNAM
ncbi:hypothetical protein [Sphingobium boeckii]|uniref:Uncharacterized protein involved in copper resistance n=1 Tax=Sphingobium boeckii TaxID=1082345 RepID=A0A7W9AJW4_9SPHN|nr:hypothetical protein [Sphingobium boeckii]MBB5687040.1 uncharacterized protein involved in copper resistance [Sphingobium boeckii]